jgi:hypothetical protein
MLTDLNYLAILTSGALYWTLGGVWYAAVFARTYQAGLNFSEEEKIQSQKNFPKALAAHLVGGLISALVIAMFTRASDTTSSFGGLMCGFWPWLGFAFTIQTNLRMLERRPTSLYVLDGGFYLIAFSLMGGILAVWR